MDLSNKIIDTTGLTFDDVLVLPNYTAVRRQEIDVSSSLTSMVKLSLPFLSSPMDTVTTSKLAIALGKLGGLGVIHRNLPVARQVEEIKRIKKENLLSSAAVGVGNDLDKRVAALVQAGVDILLLDSAHGYSKWVIEATKFITQKYKHITLISGSVATADGAKALIEAGADVLRVGMGPGAICTTRIVAGIGVPQITAILETATLAKKYDVRIIADGGLRSSGDIVKALACGASLVMAGSLFAGCQEAAGKIVDINGKKFKSYRGMGSVSAMKEGSAVRYGQEYKYGQEKKLIAEGVEGMVPYKGTLEEVVIQLTGGLKAGMYYAGVKSITELQEKTRLIKVTQASLIESHPHDIIFNE